MPLLLVSLLLIFFTLSLSVYLGDLEEEEAIISLPNAPISISSPPPPITVPVPAPIPIPVPTRGGAAAAITGATAAGELDPWP
jgi:hypothetical protein